MLNKIYIHHITTLFVLKYFIISGCLVKKKKKKKKKNGKSESASLLVKIGIDHEIMIGASLLIIIIKTF